MFVASTTMVYRTGVLISDNGVDRYIQVETILAYYQQQYITTGKHLAYEDETFIGNVIIEDQRCTFNGFGDFSQQALADIQAYLLQLIIPQQQDLAAAFGFGLQLHTDLILCEVILNTGLYEVWFDGRKVAGLSQNERCSWQQVAGERLLPSLIREITRRIENYYNQF